MTASTKTTAIKGGILVSGRNSKRADIYIKDGRVDRIESDGKTRPASHIIDASGKWVLPGIIDAHIHPVYADRIDTLSQAAACEGITTIIPYIGAVKAWGESRGLLDAIDDFITEGENTSLVDFSIHGTLLQNDVKDSAETIPVLVEKGIMSFKTFMAYKKRGMKLEDDELLHIMSIISKQNAILAAHAENGAVIDYFESVFISAGKATPDDYPPSHPGLSEAEAIFRLLTFGKVTKCPIYIPHISAKESLAVVQLFKKWGEPEFYVETCPHYLTLTDEEMSKRGSIAKMSPPLRKQADIEEMWQAVREGLIDVIASDTAGHTIKANEPLWDNIFSAPNGIPGIDTLFKVVYNDGVNSGKVTLNRLVEVMCEKPAKIFGLYPRKGIIVEGADADIVIFDPAVRSVIPARNPLLKVDYSMYAKQSCLGAAIMVLQRGNILMENGELMGNPGQGKFLPGTRVPPETI